MDAMFEKIATQVPDLVALIVVVSLFLKAMARRDQLIEDMNRESLEARQHSRSIIEDNTRVMGEVVKVIEGCVRRK